MARGIVRTRHVPEAHSPDLLNVFWQRTGPTGARQPAGAAFTAARAQAVTCPCHSARSRRTQREADDEREADVVGRSTVPEGDGVSLSTAEVDGVSGSSSSACK